MPVVASAVHIDHWTFRRRRRESGAPPLPGCRTKAMRLPSGDQRGEKSRELDGESQKTGVESFVKIPIQLWSVRFATNANRDSSGDQARSPSSPRILSNFVAAAEPLIGDIQISWFFVKATRSPRGGITGSSPSASAFGSPPSKARDHTCTLSPRGP